jgi:putative endonuclease
VSRSYYLYIVASISRVLYVGMTHDLLRCVHEHKYHEVDGFTKKYRCTRLVYFEESGDVMAVIEREKQLKGWRREKKLALIESMNPQWHDLYIGLTG